MAAAQTNEKKVRVIVDEVALRASASRANSIIAQIGAGNTNLSALAGGLNSASTAATGAGRAAQGANDNFKSMGASAGHASGGILEMAKHLGSLTLGLAGLGALTMGVHAFAEAMVEASDHATEVTARIMSFTHSQKDAAEAQSQIVAIANATRSSLPAVAELYSKIGIQADHLHMSLGQVGLATKVFSETLKISGSTTAQSKAAMLQLGEAFDIGQLNGRHFIAMMMDNIAFMRLLAQSMGVSQGKLKELSTEGKVTADQLKKALTDPALIAQVEQQFGRMPVSFADVRTGIHNTLVQLAGDFANGAGINTSLAVLYARIVKFAEDAKPAFMKIGVAVRAAFEAFAPMGAAAIDAIKPVFSFVLDNGPVLIQLLKVGVETWIAYRAAQAAAAGISMASKFITEAKSLAMFLDLAKGGSGAVGALKGAFLIASEGVNTFTGALLANPLTAIAVVITGVIALLYEFRDSISLGGGSMASLGDLFRAVWEMAGPLIKTVTGYVSEFTSWISDKLGGALSWVEGIFGDVFGSFDFSIAGALRMVARFIDFMVTGFKGWWTVTKDIFQNIPGYFHFIFASAANLAISALESLANGARHIVNNIIGGLNSAFGSNISMMADVKLGRVDTGGFGEKVARDLAGVTNSHTAERGVESLLTRAGQIGAARRAAGAGTVAAGATAPAGAEGAGGEGDKDAAKKAKQEKEFWETLKNQLATAKLFGLELAKVTEEQKLQKILGHDLNASQKSAVDSLVEQIAAAKALTEVIKSTFELHNKNTLLQARSASLTEDQAKIEDALDAARLSALNAGVNINTKDYQTALAKLRTELLINQALEKQVQARKDALDFAKKYSLAMSAQSEAFDMGKQRANFEDQFKNGNVLDAFGQPISQTMHDAIIKGYDKALADVQNKPFQVAIDYAKSAIKDYGTDDERRAAVGSDRDKTVAGLTDARNAGRISAGEFAAGVRKAGDDFDKAIADIGNAFSRSMTALSDVFNQLGSALGGKAGDVATGIGGITKTLGSFSKTQESVTGDLTKVLGDKNSGLAKAIGDKVGGAISGLEIGKQVGSVMTSLGIKGSGTGSSIGGAIGGAAFGPLGALAGSVLGGLFGSLFYKPQSSNASFTANADGTVGVGGVVGSNGQLRQAASGAAGEVLTGLSQIASAIGGTLTGVPNLTIGTWDSKWRVLDNQRTTADLHSKNFSMGNNLHDFGSDEASAVAYAIAEALKQGVITGLSGLAQKALQVLDSDSAIAFIQNWTKVLADYKAIIDPVGAAVSGVIDPLKTLLDTMNKVGASTEDLTKLQNYQTLSLKKALDAQLSTLNSLMKTLNGDGSGRTALARLNDDLAQFATFKTKIAAGDTSVDQNAFSSLAGEIQGLVGSVYGTSTSQGQDILSSLKDATSTLMGNITTAFNNDAGYDVSAAADQITNALAGQTSQIVSQQTITNTLLQQLVNNTGGTNGGSDVAANNNDVSAYELLAKNGEFIGINY